MKIVIPISRFEKSGGMRTLIILANGLAAKGHQVAFVVPKGQHKPSFPISPLVAIEVVGKDVGRLPLISGLLKKFQLALQMPRADVAIANAYMTAYVVWVSHLLKRVRHPVYFVQSYEPWAFGEFGDGNVLLKKIRTILAKWTYNLPFRYLCNSKRVQDLLSQRHNCSSDVVPMGVDLDIFQPRPRRAASNGTAMMTIGNKNRVKRYPLFLEAVSILAQDHSIEAWVASDDSALPLPAGVPAKREQPRNDCELAELYASASVFVSTSRFEGFGLPLLEAMACGTPVVTTNSGGILDFCSNRENCLIVESDRAEDVASAMREVLTDSALRQKLIRNGLETARRWNWAEYVDCFERLIDRNAL